MLGVKFRSDRDWAGAIAAFSRAIEQTPDLQPAYLLRGECRWETLDYAGAEQDFSETIRIYRTDLSSYYKRGYTRAKMGKHESALADFEWILMRDPTNRYALTEHAVSLVHARRYPAAWRELTALLELHLDDVRAYAMRSVARCGMGDAAGALLDCDAAIAAGPKEAEPYRYRAQAKFQLGLQAAALKDYQRFVALSNGSPDALFQLALFLEMTGDFTGALAAYDQALVINPGEHAALLHRVIVRQRLQQPAGNELAEALPSLPNEWASALGLYLTGRWPEAGRLQAAANSDGELAPAREGEAYYFSGMMNLLQGNQAYGLELLQKCAATRRDSADYWLALAEIARRKNQASQPQDQPR